MRSDFSFGILIGLLQGLAIALLVVATTHISWLKDWQTLLTGGLAILAAYITVQPARMQLLHMAVQSSIMARDDLAVRLQETEKRRTYLLSETDKLVGAWIRIWPNDPDDDPQITAEWAHHTEQLTYNLRRIVREDHARLQDPSGLNDIKLRLVDRLGALEKCLYAIHAPESVHFDDPELGLTAQQIADEKARVDAEAAEALGQVASKFADVRRSREELRIGFRQRVVSLRKRLRAIDDLIDERAFADV